MFTVQDPVLLRYADDIKRAVVAGVRNLPRPELSCPGSWSTGSCRGPYATPQPYFYF